MNKRIILLLTFVGVLFMSMAVYLSVFGVIKADELEKTVYNQRLNDKENKVLRGKIYDFKGEVLAESKIVDGKSIREYPYGSLYTHVIGYNSEIYGKSKLELSYNDYLMGESTIVEAVNLASAVTGDTKKGMDLTLTLSHKLQNYASDVLGNKKGCIIVMDAETGKIRAMVSKPTFNPAEPYLSDGWGDLAEREDSPFLSRATGGLYAPGSTWKIITSASIIEEGLEEEVMTDEGKIIVGEREYENSKGKAFGEISLKEAFYNSSNVYFAKMGEELGKDALGIYDDFLLGKSIEFDFPLADSYLSDKVYKMTDADIASTSIGQGKLMVSPLYMTMVASAIANGGEMLSPYIVEKAEIGSIIAYEGKSKIQAKPVDYETSEKIKEMMALCVEEGTGRAAFVPGLKVYGKTGTAQNETDKSHDWFVGFAENEDGESSVICVMLEYNGVGSSEAASMAGRVLSYWLG